jgi:hypothetical protein
MGSIYREVYVGCGERSDGRWDLIVIPPGGGRNEMRIIRPDLDMVEGMEIAAQLRERVRDFPQAEDYSPDELLALCARLIETV